MTADLVVRYDEAGRAATEQTLRTLVRKQGIALLGLGILWGLVTLLPLVAATISAGHIDAVVLLAFTALLAIPVAIGALGVRQLRRHPRLPAVAVTITSDAVRFPSIERPSGLAPRIRAEEWARAGTSAKIIPASGLLPARVEFTGQAGGKRRRRSVAADTIDVDPRLIVETLNGSGTSASPSPEA
ncbi:hypothetical protein ACFJGV_04030 [Cnuibacter sp. UC19_7]|uniref:hypothetical protein n=1 Tax=Cnuibacter sp. UC19_7 TaxID=3350166 RepID=UPI003670FA65